MGEPLQPHVEADIVRMPTLEFGDSGAVEVLEVCRPALPAGARAALDHGKGEAFEKRVKAQAVAALRNKSVEIGRVVCFVTDAALSPGRPEIAKGLELDLCYSDVIDEIGLAKACQLPFEFRTTDKT